MAKKEIEPTAVVCWEITLLNKRGHSNPLPRDIAESYLKDSKDVHYDGPITIWLVPTNTPRPMV